MTTTFQDWTLNLSQKTAMRAGLTSAVREYAPGKFTWTDAAPAGMVAFDPVTYFYNSATGEGYGVYLQDRGD